jgi:hypothetical protein
MKKQRGRFSGSLTGVAYKNDGVTLGGSLSFSDSAANLTTYGTVKNGPVKVAGEIQATVMDGWKGSIFKSVPSITFSVKVDLK